MMIYNDFVNDMYYDGNDCLMIMIIMIAANVGDSDDDYFDNDDSDCNDNSNDNDRANDNQTMNVQITLHIYIKGFYILSLDIELTSMFFECHCHLVISLLVL